MGFIGSLILSLVCTGAIVWFTLYSSQRKLSSILLERKIYRIIARTVSNLVCFLIITLALWAHIDDEDRWNLVLSAVIVACNICAGLIYRLLGQDPNTKFKYDMQGFLVVIMVALALCGEWDLCKTILLVVLGSYIDFDITTYKAFLSRIKREIIPRILCSALVIAIVFCITESVEKWGGLDALGLALPPGLAILSFGIYAYCTKKSNRPPKKSKMEEHHQHLLGIIKDYIQKMDDIEGLLLIGSRAAGNYDMYSDVDLMAGCLESASIDNVVNVLREFFNKRKDCYIKEQKWPQNVLGLSVYYKDGASIDISFMPTSELVIRAPHIEILISKTENFEKTVNTKHQEFANRMMRYWVDDSVHYQFIYELRRVDIALLREQFVFADIALNNARQLLLSVQAMAERKKLHQLKEFNTLSQTFLNRLEETYPQSRNYEDMYIAKERLLTLYLETVSSSDYLMFDDNLSILIGRADLPQMDRSKDSI